MSGVLPTPREAQQLCRLRALRVQKAQDACTRAQAAVDAALAAVRQRQAEIAQARARSDELGLAIVGALVPHLPRWSKLVATQRERLAERVEIAEFSLIGDERALEEARERLEQARSELTRALAREDAVRSLAGEARSAHAREAERRSERELDEPARRAVGAAQA